MSQSGPLSVTDGMLPPDVPTSFVTDSGIAVPVANTLNIFGTTVAAGSIPFQFTGLGDTVTGEIQLSQAIAATDATKVGLASFNSAQFSVDANGFVSSLGGSGSTSFNVDASTAPGTDPVVPDGGGIVTVTGAQVAAGVVGTNVIRTNSLAANTYTTEIQRSTATGVSTVASNGVSHFNSAQFSVDANGFVSASTTGLMQTLTGNSGVATPVANNINVVTANSTVKFIGSGDDLTQDFSLSNLCLGTSLPSITSGVANCTFGQSCGPLITTGSTNSFYGNFCASSIQQGSSNSAFGASSLSAFNFLSNTVTGNSAFGWSSLGGLTTGSFNTAVGYRSLNGVLTGVRNVALGNDSGINYTTSESSNIVIGNIGTILDNNTIRIGTQGAGAGQQNKCFVAGITGVTVANTNIVSLDTTTGQLGALSTVPLANGGTNASLVASNGGIFYSTATAGAILAGTATALRMLQSGASTTPAWSTTTWPATSTVNRILFSSATNVVGQITTANNGTLVTSATGVPSILVGPGATGRMFQSTAAAAPAWSTATYPATTTSQQILYSTAANVVGQLTTANSAIAATNAAGTLAMRALSVVIQTFVANGTYTPTTGMLYCIIEIQAPGGGGGGSASTTAGQLAYGSGGGGGEYARGVFSAATVGASQTVTCPAGGAGGTAGANNGTAGATASVGVLITAVGGSAGLGMAATSTTGGSVGGNGGSGGTGGSFRLRGGYGTTSAVSFGVITIAGNGGTSSFSQGAQALTTTGTGTTGTGYGGGGGGGQSFVSAAAQAGGAGSSGIVVITEYVIA